MNIDIVIPYVNSEDPIWQLTFKTCVDIERIKARTDPTKTPLGIEANRFRDFGTFKYLLRGIETCCPWVRRIWIVLQQPSQKPAWLKESDRLRVVYHNEIIPQEYLPTFNSATIEMFVWKIKGLSERFLYLNDDTFPLRPLKPLDFWDSKGRPRISVREEPAPKMIAYIRMLKNSEAAAMMAVDETDHVFDMSKKLKDTHTWTPMKKSTWKLLFDRVGDIIYSSLTPFRNSKNIVQQISTYWWWMSGQYAPLRIDGKMDSFLHTTPEEMAEVIVGRKHDILCMNDTGVQDYESVKKIIEEAFLQVYPNKSSFEI